MKKLLQHCIAAVLIGSGFGATAQDIHFSQYNASPLFLNPALAGMNNCDYRVYTNFRLQWPTVSAGNTYRTVAAGADMSVGKVTKYNSFAGMGLSFYSDQAGALNLSSNQVALSVAYHFMLNRKGTMQLSTGIQGAFNFVSINASKATFDSQFDPLSGTVDPAGTRENFARNRVLFGDAGFGAVYSALTRKQQNFYLGFALTNLAQPRVAFNPSGFTDASAGSRRLIKATIHGGASLPVGKSDKVSLLPNFMFLVQGPANQFNVGLAVRSLLGNSKTAKTAITAGLQYRGIFDNNFYDALIAAVRVEVKGFSAGVSYDVNVSKLLVASRSVGAPEISLMYQGCYRKKARPGHCPVMF